MRQTRSQKIIASGNKPFEGEYILRVEFTIEGTKKCAIMHILSEEAMNVESPKAPRGYEYVLEMRPLQLFRCDWSGMDQTEVHYNDLYWKASWVATFGEKASHDISPMNVVQPRWMPVGPSHDKVYFAGIRPEVCYKAFFVPTKYNHLYWRLVKKS